MTEDPGARTTLSGETTRQRRKKQRPQESRLELATVSACRHDRNHDMCLPCSAEACKTANRRRQCSLGSSLRFGAWVTTGTVRISGTSVVLASRERTGLPKIMGSSISYVNDKTVTKLGLLVDA